MTTRVNLRFDAGEIDCWASRYNYGDDEMVEKVGPRTHVRGYFTRPDFLTLCRWKARRAERHFIQNGEKDIRSVTALAMATRDERLKICLLMALSGVNWPMASVMLHFGAKDRYPILDRRALWSLGVEVYGYTFPLWWDYTQFCRQLADKAQVTMRTLDRALWQYSKEKQRLRS